MKPLQKEDVIALLREANYIVGMRGDGVNDCAALSAAHCGIALSEAEASVVSHFTAKNKTLSSVVHLMHEGRACLANSFAMFKLTLICGFVELSQAMFAYTHGTDMSEWMYLSIDFFMFIPFAFYTVKSLASNKLKGDPPTAQVFGIRTLSSMIGIVAIGDIMIWLGIVALQHQPWYTPSQVNDSVYSIPETTTAWLIGNFVYCGVVVAFAFGSSHRQSLWLNLGLQISVLFVLAFTSVLIWIYPAWDILGIYPFT